MFTAIDVETANEDLMSICQIGIATVQSTTVVDVWTTLINPLGSFSPRHTAIHGIDRSMVAGAPSFSEIIDELKKPTMRQSCDYRKSYSLRSRCYYKIVPQA